MVQTHRLKLVTPLAVLRVLPQVLAHGHDGSMAMGASSETQAHFSNSTLASANMTIAQSPQSYFSYREYSGLMLAHIVLMTVAWLFVLPIGEPGILRLGAWLIFIAGVMLSVARSRLAVLVQLGFLGINGVALLLGTIYNSKTPDLYESNSHHKLGWVVIWIVLAQSIMAVIKLYASRLRPVMGHAQLHGFAPTPVSAEAMAQHHQMQETYVPGRGRYSDDNGHGTASETPRTHSMSGTTDCGDEFRHDFQKAQDAESEADLTEKRSLLGHSAVDRFLSNMPNKIPRRMMTAIDVVHQTVNYSILLLGFIAITTGVVVYGGIFVSFACSPLKFRNSNDKAAARQQCLQRACALRQRRYLLLVRSINT